MISQARFAGDAAEPMPSKISAIGRFWWSLILAGTHSTIHGRGIAEPA
jgi:hypothetical protein